MRYKLTLQNHVEGVSQTSWYVLPPALVGRDPDSQVCVDHDSISRKHCELALAGDGSLTIKDLGSMNGTYVNDDRVTKSVLMPGQMLQIGALQLQIEFITEDEPEPSASRSAKGSMYTTQPMETFQPVALPPEKSWWQKIFG